MFRTQLVLASKRNLRLKCSQCRQLLPAAHFKHFQGTPMHSLICMNCKKMCVVCGVRQPLENFREDEVDTCNQCSAKVEVARGNVFFRYPILKYRACPFNVDEMREQLQKEEEQRWDSHAGRTQSPEIGRRRNTSAKPF